jgi:hypothetical protein
MKKPQREDTFVRLAAAVHRAAMQQAPDVPSRTDATEVRPGKRERSDVVVPSVGARAQDRFLYDSDTELSPFSHWILYAPDGTFSTRFRPHRGGAEGTLTMRAVGTEAVGISKSLPVLSGAVMFECQVIEPHTDGWHIYFAMIPMQQSQRGRLEVGGEIPVDPRNERSPYRLRMFVPGKITTAMAGGTRDV